MRAAQERAEFDTGESYFHDVRPLLEHVFSRVRREEFRFEAETDGISEPDNPEYDQRFATVYNGNGCIGCAIGISFAAPFAVVNLSDYSRYQDGSIELLFLRNRLTQAHASPDLVGDRPFNE